MPQRPHTKKKCVAWIDAPLPRVTVSLWASRPEWICHWSGPSEVKVAPCAAVPKPEKIRVGVPLPGALSVEIGDGGAVGLAGHEHKGVVAARSRKRVGTQGEQRVGAGGAGAAQPGAYRIESLDIGRQAAAGPQFVANGASAYLRALAS